jgi:hypothetical protein
MIAGAAVGAAAIQGLHAQAKLKAYSVGEVEVTNAAAQPGYLPAVRKAIENAHGRTLRTLNGRVVSIFGGAPPSMVSPAFCASCSSIFCEAGMLFPGTYRQILKGVGACSPSSKPRSWDRR